MVVFTDAAGIVPHFAREEAERRHQYYLGPEHLLLGLLIEADSPAARVLRAHGLDLDTVRAGIDRLVAAGVLPGPQPSDAELLATLRRRPAGAAAADPALPPRPGSRDTAHLLAGVPVRGRGGGHAR
jgi:ATP-dependent Clp protease ATP-binding subunit ClpA